MIAFSRLAALGVILISAASASDASAAVSAIAFERDLKSVWAMPSGGGDAVQLFDEGHEPDFSPSGKRIAFVTPQGVVVSDIDGTDRVTVYRSASFLIRIDYGPGGLIAFTERYAFGDAPDLLRVVNADGSGLRTVYTAPDNGVVLCCPALAPDGSRIVFARWHFSGQAPGQGLWTVGTDGSNPSQLTAPDYPDRDPRFSPNGSRIAFARVTVPGPDFRDVFVMNPDGTSVANLTNDPSRNDFSPVFSPGGDAIAFASAVNDGSDSRIDVMRADGAGRRALTAGLAGSEYAPTWANIAALPEPPAPAPAAGKRFEAQPVKGKVRFRCKGDGSWKRLRKEDQLAVGCRLDTRDGSARITSAANRDGSETQSAVFSKGVFKVKQKAERSPTTELELVGKLNGCAGAGAAAQGPSGRRLESKGSGRFSIRGRRSIASARHDFTALVHDRCDGSTLTKMGRGDDIRVRDLVRDKTVLLAPGQRYVAEPPR